MDAPADAPAAPADAVLSAGQRAHFLDRGYVLVPQAVPQSVVARFANASWARTGYDQADSTTWEKQFLRLEPTMSAPMKTEAPRAYGAISELVGGASRLEVATLTDTMIMNLGAAGRRAGAGMDEWMSPLETARAGKGGWCAVPRRLVAPFSPLRDTTSSHAACASQAQGRLALQARARQNRAITRRSHAHPFLLYNSSIAWTAYLKKHCFAGRTVSRHARSGAPRDRALH